LPKALVIVESPAKAKTINKYLGKDYEVEASLGHVKDLPKSGLGVDVDNDFATELVVIPGKEKVVSGLKKKAGKATAVYLAPDPDREGEAIAAHLAEEFGVTRRREKSKIPVYRVTFNEITQRAVKEAFEHPRGLDWNLVDAQQARRVLDRLVGYKISPLLWDKVRRGLSAGRVQTVALRFIVEREKEVRAFQKQEYWTIDALLEGATPPVLEARFTGRNGQRFEKLQIGDQAQAEAITGPLQKAEWSVVNVERREQQRRPLAPFTTSKFQQDGARKLGLPVKVAMGIAQKLYMGVELGSEGSVGLITYMRTDSVRVSGEAVAEARSYIAREYGEKNLPEAPNFYRSKKGNTQDAHEAIRPTSVEQTPERVRRYLQPNEYRVYTLIWQRFVASQMTPAVYDRTTVDIDAREGEDVFNFRVTGSVLKAPGFLAVYEAAKEARDEEDEELSHQLPPLEAGQKLRLEKLKPEQHFTEPPPRYNEASLVKELEERGVGRPSTYAQIISSIQDRGYVIKHEKRFVPTETGEVVAELLVKSFDDIFDPNYTARLEEELDDIEEGREKWTVVMEGFYKRLEKDIRKAQKEMVNIKTMKKPTSEKCERCGSPMVERWGRHGWFLACSTYDKKKKGSCDFTREKPDKDLSVDQDAEEEICEECGQPMILRRGRFGQFMACTSYPKCRSTRRLDQGKRVPDIPLDEKCPQCDRNMVMRHGRFGEFTSCSGYPACKYIKQNFIGVKCPECKQGDLVEKKARTRGNLFYGCGRYPECKFTSNWKPVAEKCPQCGSEYLVEKMLKAGPVLACPNARRSEPEEEEPRPRRKGKAPAKEGAGKEAAVKCDYSRPLPAPVAAV
jgi:DNA topoisomerase-1